MSQTRRAYIRGTIFLMLFNVHGLSQADMTLSGPITANDAVITGSVSVSSATVSTMTISALLNVTGSLKVPGVINQSATSSTSAGIFVSTTTWTEVSDLSQTVSASSSKNYFRISICGPLEAYGTGPSYLTVFRDNTNLGDSSDGLSGAFTGPLLVGSTAYSLSNVGVDMVDFVGDTSTHTYKVMLRSEGFDAEFAQRDTAYFRLEEFQGK